MKLLGTKSDENLQMQKEGSVYALIPNQYVLVFLAITLTKVLVQRKQMGGFFSNRNLHSAASLKICVWEEVNSCETDVSVSQNDHFCFLSNILCVSPFLFFFSPNVLWINAGR